MLPEFRKGFIYLAVAMGQATRYKEAALQYRKAISMKADPVFYEEELLKIFRQLAMREQTVMNHYSYGVVLRQFGHFDAALVEQQKAIAMDPSNGEINLEISNLQKVISARTQARRD